MSLQKFYRQTGQAIASYLHQELELVPGRHYTFGKPINGPRLLLLSLRDINPVHSKKIMVMGEPLSMACKLDKSTSIRVSRGDWGALCLELPKPPSLWYTVAVSSLPRRRGLLTSVGVDSQKKPTLIDFSDPLTPHVLLAGCTGSGKTNCLKLLAYDLAAQNEPTHVNFVLIDCRKMGVNWRPFRNIPHLAHPVITQDDMALKALNWSAREINRRAESGQRLPHLFVCVDEAQDLLEQANFVKVLGDIAAVGREFNVHLLCAMQNPTAKQLGDASIKRNLSCRLVGRTDSATSAHVATGQKGSGAELLTGAGDLLLIKPTGVTRLTAALLTSQDLAKLPRTENMKRLDLGDVDHVQPNMARRKADPLQSHEVAVAIVHDGGINKLARMLGIGSTKAQRVLEFARDLKRDLALLRHGVQPLSHTTNTTIPIPTRIRPN